MSTRTGPNIKLDGLILNLDFLRKDSWNIGRSEWYDLSTEKNDANLVGNPAFDNITGYFEFNDTEQFSEVQLSGSDKDLDFGTGNFTLEVWLYPLSFQSITNIIALPDDSVFSLKAAQTTGELYVQSNLFTTQGSITGWNLLINEWNCISVKREAGVLYAYYNGMFIGSETNFTNDIESSVLLIRNGGDSQFNPSRFRVVRVYNNALTSSQIKSNYEAFEQRKYDPVIAEAIFANQQISIKEEFVGRNISEFLPVEGQGGVGAYFYSISPSLPEGIEIDDLTGFVSGFSTSLSSQTYTVTVADQLNNIATNTFTLNVNASPIVLTPTSPVVDLSINSETNVQPVSASGGFGNLQYSIQPSLPENTQSEDIFRWTVTNNNVDSYTFAGPVSGDDISISVFQGATLEFNVSTGGISTGQEVYTSPGTYTFTVPAGVNSVSAVAVGGGGGGSTSTNASNGFSGGGGGGGGLGWATISVTPGETLSVVVGAGGSGGTSAGSNNATSGGDSFVDRGGNYLVEGIGGTRGTYNSSSTAPGGGFTGDGGGNGGSGGGGTGGNESGGGGGAGGYSGNGGNGGTGTGGPTDGTGGGGGGHSGANGFTSDVTAGGGGVGILGEGASGTGVDNSSGTTGGNPGSSGNGKQFGGGGTGAEDDSGAGAADGGNGAVRIIWGPTRSYPSTGTEDQQESGSPEPFWIKTAPTTGTGNAVPGVTNNGTEDGVVIWNTTDESPTTYFYNSENSADYTGSINVLAIPPDLAFDPASGTITGIANRFYDTTSHTITVNDQVSPTPQEETFTFDLTVNATPLIANADVPSIVEATDSSIQVTPVTGTGGITPYNFSISPALPSGLSFNTSTGEITGSTTSQLSSTTFTVTITDLSNQTATANFNIEITASLYEFTQFTFTAASTNGPDGPSESTLLNSYDTTTNPWLSNNSFYSAPTDGIQQWTVPQTTTYRITAKGATGGIHGGSFNPAFPGEGAEVVADIPLNQGDIVNLVVGQKPTSSTSSSGNGAGGGGGSWVYTGTIGGNGLIVVAGGGGGSGHGGNSSTGGNGKGGSSTEDSNESASGENFGVNQRITRGSVGNKGIGEGGFSTETGGTVQQYDGGGGGAGWLSNGDDHPGDGLGGARFVGGGSDDGLPMSGGFGGGGGAGGNGNAGGGAGGYTGGGAGEGYSETGSGRSWGGGGGGGSFVTATAVTSTITEGLGGIDYVDTGNGFILIQKL